LGVVALAVRWKMGSPVLIRQVRAGLHGRPFVLYKFRTMTEARDAQGNLLPDPLRLTPLGRFLRRASLDELPQFWNVVKGDMSFVGPRPLFVEYLPHYTEREGKRHLSRPGITGLAQVSGRNRLPWGERLELDVRYVERQSLALDLYLLLRTIGKVLRGSDVTEGAESNLAVERSSTLVATARPQAVPSSNGGEIFEGGPHGFTPEQAGSGGNDHG
jgi:sugar transferase EpsL